MKKSLFLLLLATSCQMPCQDSCLIEIPDVFYHSIENQTCLDDFSWWSSLNDETLISLLVRADLYSIDLDIACARINLARIQEKGGIYGLLPHIDGSLTYGHAQYNQRTVNQLLGIKGGANKTNDVNLFEVGFDVSWEIDLFGKQAHEIAALKALNCAAKEEYCLIRTSLLAEIARNYVTLRTQQMRLELLNLTLEAEKELVGLKEGLYQTGFINAQEFNTSTFNLCQHEAEIPRIELLIDQTIHRLSILLGSEPACLYSELICDNSCLTLPVAIPIGLPSDLLRRRPDIKKAEWELAAASERTESAIASLFPRLTLQGFVGDLTTFCTGGGFASFLGGQLLSPIFNSTLIQQDIDAKKLETCIASYEYQKTVLTALEESENAIASLKHEERRYQHLFKCDEVARSTYEQTYSLYDTGMIDYQTVLSAKVETHQANLSLLESRSTLLMNYIALYKALGGGW